MGRSFAAIFSLLAVAVASATCLAVGMSANRFFVVCLVAFWGFAIIGYVIGRAGDAILTELAQAKAATKEPAAMTKEGAPQPAKTEPEPPATEPAKKAGT